MQEKGAIEQMKPKRLLRWGFYMRKALRERYAHAIDALATAALMWLLFVVVGAIIEQLAGHAYPEGWRTALAWVLSLLVPFYILSWHEGYVERWAIRSLIRPGDAVSYEWNPHERFFLGATHLSRGKVLSVEQRVSPPANYDSFFLERWSQCVIRILDGDHVREVPADLVNL